MSGAMESSEGRLSNEASFVVAGGWECGSKSFVARMRKSAVAGSVVDRECGGDQVVKCPGERMVSMSVWVGGPRVRCVELAGVRGSVCMGVVVDQRDVVSMMGSVRRVRGLHREKVWTGRWERPRIT